jgi:hypothetical protein
MFDSSTALAQRRLRLVASIPVGEDPLQIGSHEHRMRVPWIDWPRMEARAGFLVVSSASKPEIKGASGMSLISSESSEARGTTAPRHRRTFRVEDPRQLGEISWTPLPGRVSVLVDSQVTIHPDSAEWLVVLRYDVVGGALDSIHFRMPAAWSPNADLRFPGGRHQLTTETRGQTAVWTITPEHPIWGSQRMVLRSSRPLAGEREITYPEISPLGKGAVDARLAVFNATGRPAAIEAPFGLAPTDRSLRDQPSEFAHDTGVLLGAFRVVEESPTLRIQLPRDTAGSVDSRDGPVRLGFADVAVLVMPDGSNIGRASYDPVPGSGGFLPIELPADSALLWATLDSNPVIPLRRSSGVWSIALDETRPSHVSVIWRKGPSRLQSTRSAASVGIPRVAQGMATTLVTFHLPAQLTLAGDTGILRPTSIARLEMARADWLARSIVDCLPRIDRSSNRDHQKLATMLISHELSLRSASRSEAASQSSVKAVGGRADADPAWTQTARAARAEAVRRAGLEQDLALASHYLGDRTSTLKSPSVLVPDPNPPERIRTFGRPISFLGILPGIDVSPARNSFALEREPWTESHAHLSTETIIALLLLFLIGLSTTLLHRSRRARAATVLLALGLAGYAGGSVSLAGALGLVIAGWRKARSESSA